MQRLNPTCTLKILLPSRRFPSSISSRNMKTQARRVRRAKLIVIELTADGELQMDPPVDTPGRWVPVDQFPGSKSFGVYFCEHCSGKHWVSAHAIPRFTQACKACNTYSKPKYMWVNEQSRGKKEDRPAHPMNGHHDRERCEACRHGACTASSNPTMLF